MHPRVFVLSMPKAGTYLMAELLARAGLAATQLHVNDDSVDDYASLSLEQGRVQPERARRQSKPVDALALIGPGQFAVGHLAYTQALERALQEFHLVFLRRDPRTALVSYVRFLVDSGRAEARGVPWRLQPTAPLRLQHFLEHEGLAHLERFRRLLPWAGHPAVFQLRFEDLAQSPSAETRARIEQLLGWLGCAPQSVSSLFEQVHATPTITSSASHSNAQGWWNDAALAWWRAHGGASVAREYGYAED
ncbi:MAG: sulfotransferase domain-containing protein [Lysobacteraceae bacterium]